MQLGIIADDFTGAGDVANSVARLGHSTMLAFGRCPLTVPRGTDVLVVALKSRSAPTSDAVRMSLVALHGLAALGCRRIFFKICSTFDSTPAGNIGPVADALADELTSKDAIIVCPAFPQAARFVFQGHLFVGDRLLSESGMEHHPLNPMTDPDIRRWLAHQTRHGVGHLPFSVVGHGDAAILKQIAEDVAAGRRMIVADASTEADLATLGRIVRDSALVVGASGLAAGLAANLPTDEQAGGPRLWSGVDGPALILAGSCSRATLAQVDHYRRHAPALAIDATAVCEGISGVEEALAFVRAHLADAPLVYSSSDKDVVAEAQVRFGHAVLASRLEAFFGELSQRAVQLGIRRLVVAGGETSGAVVSALDLPPLEIGPEIAIGVPAMRTADGSLAVVLKSGNFGGVDFFDVACDALGSTPSSAGGVS